MSKTLITALILCILLVPASRMTGQEDVFTSASHLEMVPDDIIGVALYPDGQTPIIDLPVRVWSVDRDKMVYRSRTDSEGVFRIPRLISGKCFVFVGRVKINMRVLAQQQQKDVYIQRHDLVVVLPRGYLLSSIKPDMVDVLLLPTLLAPAQVLPEPPKVVSP